MSIASEAAIRTTARANAVEWPLGATLTETGARFCVWAPAARQLDLHLVAPEDRVIPMRPETGGYWTLETPDIRAGARYCFRIDGHTDRPDPASRSQPNGVHSPSELIDWRSPDPARSWESPALRDYIIYELHPGTFTPEGTLDAMIPSLDRLASMGITAIEIMPVAEFPGARNWGYDGVFPYAAEGSYGGAAALKRLARACHVRGMALILDVVYNHLGPEGNYLSNFGPYFTDSYKTPWGTAINFDGPASDHVRRYFLENALYWLRDCEVDSLRLDAVHAIYDRSAYPFLQELADQVHDFRRQTRRNIYLIAESDLNDARLLRTAEMGGCGLDAQWADDLHHCIHTLLTGERNGYYADFGSIEQFAKALERGWVYDGTYSPSRDRRYGNSTEGLAPQQFVVCSQNHDQIGNRMKGERLCHLVDADKTRLAAAAVLLSPFTPLLFMGEEYAEPAPFLYYVSHSDPYTQAMVRKGRKEEFAAFADQGEPPDPGSAETFFASKLNQSLVAVEPHASVFRLYCELIRLRRSHPAVLEMGQQQVAVRGGVVESVRWSGDCRIRLLFNFSDTPAPLPAGSTVALNTGLAEGVLAPWSCAMLTDCKHQP